MIRAALLFKFLRKEEVRWVSTHVGNILLFIYVSGALVISLQNIVYKGLFRYKLWVAKNTTRYPAKYEGPRLEQNPNTYRTAPPR